MRVAWSMFFVALILLLLAYGAWSFAGLFLATLLLLLLTSVA